MKIALHEPGIAPNTGNIGRTCVVTDSELHLIRPYGFRINEKEIKRAGLDYWKELKLFEYMNYADFMEKNPGARIFFATTKAYRLYTDVAYEPDDIVMFGNESRGIPEEILAEHPDTCIRIPMWSESRSLNLANSVAIILYEALRQQGFSGFKLKGDLHRLQYKK